MSHTDMKRLSRPLARSRGSRFICDRRPGASSCFLPLTCLSASLSLPSGLLRLFSLSLFLLFFCFEFSFLLPLNISSFLSFLSVSPPHESEALPLSPAPIGRFSDECQQIKCKHTETKQPGAGFLSDLSRSKSKHLEAIVLMHDGNSFKKPHEGERCGARRDKPDEGLRVTERSV